MPQGSSSHIQYSTQSEQIIMWGTNKPTPRNSTGMWEAVGGGGNEHSLSDRAHVAWFKWFGYHLATRSSWVNAKTIQDTHSCDHTLNRTPDLLSGDRTLGCREHSIGSLHSNSLHLHLTQLIHLLTLFERALYFSFKLPTSSIIWYFCSSNSSFSMSLLFMDMLCLFRDHLFCKFHFFLSTKHFHGLNFVSCKNQLN